MDPIQAANILFSIWDMLQRGNLEMQPPATGAPEVPTTDSAPRVYELQQRMDRMALVARAMWTLLAEKAGLTEEDLAKRITDLDAADGVVDGRVGTPPPVPCSCGAMVSRKFNRCLFCGKQYSGAGTSAFDTV